MEQQNRQPRYAHDLSRRDLLKAGLATGAALSIWSPYRGSALWGETTETPKRGGILRVRGRDPVHFDPHLTRDARTHSALSFLCSRLLRYKVGGDVRPGTFIVEPDLAERWEEPDDTTYVFHLRQGVKWLRPSMAASSASGSSATRSMTLRARACVADRLAASRTACSAQSALRPRISARLRMKATASLVALADIASASGGGVAFSGSDPLRAGCARPGASLSCPRRVSRPRAPASRASRRSAPASPRRDWCPAPSPRHGWHRGCRSRRSRRVRRAARRSRRPASARRGSQR